MLAKKNGRDGEDCWVAVDGQVYDVSASPQWSNGSHIPSNNLAYCGVDGSAVIGKAPHGRDIMKSWPKVGQYVQ